MSLDAQILTALRADLDVAVSGAELSQKLHVSRAAIWARVEELRSLGYDIEASPHRGYRLLERPRCAARRRFDFPPGQDQSRRA